MLMEMESAVDFDDVWMVSEPVYEERGADEAFIDEYGTMEEMVPGRYKTEDAAKRWYDTDVLILVGHDDVEEILNSEPVNRGYLEQG